MENLFENFGIKKRRESENFGKKSRVESWNRTILRSTHQLHKKLHRKPLALRLVMSKHLILQP